MSLESEKIKCALCGAYLFDEDDVVCCPVCGAPHHRDCYNSIGRCALEDKHGTDEQYKKPEQAEQRTENTAQSTTYITCGMCGEKYEAGEKNCPNCGTPDVSRGRFAGVGFDFLGGVPADMDLGNGVTADEAKRFVMANTPRYLPKFAANTFGKRTSWNWLAFLFPSAWCLSRKMYKLGILLTVLMISLSLLAFPFMEAVDTLNLEEISGYTELAEELIANTDTIGAPAMVGMAACLVGKLAIMIVFGILGDYFYKKHCIDTISSVKAESDDIETDFRKKGGVNIIWFLIGILAIDYLPQIIYGFVGM